jgi:hypothetical protein
VAISLPQTAFVEPSIERSVEFTKNNPLLVKEEGVYLREKR